MTTVLDAWRAVDPGARLVSGSVERLTTPVRGVARTRAVPPHLPQLGAGHLLVADAAVLGGGGVDAFLAAVRDAGLEPSCVWIVVDESVGAERAGDDVPVLAGSGTAASRADEVARYLESEVDRLAEIAGSLRLAAAEAALADPQPSAPAGVIAARLQRGVAVDVGGALVSINPRVAGRALATRFAAAHTRLLGARVEPRSEPRRTRDGLWVLERAVGPRSTAWLFDDLPFARVDGVALDALAVTLRALLRRPAAPSRRRGEPAQPPSSGDPLRDTLLAVARANGRVAPAARALGVHRNTVLYRLRRASAELGIDPRRPDDALRLLQEARARD